LTYLIKLCLIKYFSILFFLRSDAKHHVSITPKRGTKENLINNGDQQLNMGENRYQIIVQELVRRSNEDTRRLRSLEQRMDSLENRIGTTMESNLSRTKKINTKFAELDVKTSDINTEIIKIKNLLEKITRQMNKFAQKRDIKEIEKMFDLLSPIKQEFITRDELEEELNYKR